jgi:hypothetical protein
LSTAQIAAIELDDLAVLTTTQVVNMTAAQIKALSLDQVNKLTTTQTGAMTTAQLAANTYLEYLNG